MTLKNLTLKNTQLADEISCQVESSVIYRETNCERSVLCSPRMSPPHVLFLIVCTCENLLVN